MSELNKLKVVDFTMGRSDSEDVNTDVPFTENFEKTRTIQQANVVIGAYVNRNYKDMQNKADKDEIPTKLSELTNDVGYITTGDIPSKTSELTNNGEDGVNPFITNQVNDLVNYTNNTDLATLLSDKVSTTDLNNVKSAIDYKSTSYMGNVTVESIRSKKMFDGILEQGAYGYIDGAKISSTNYCRSVHKIPVIEGKTYTLSFVSSIPFTLNDCGFVFFNNDTYVSGQQNTLTVTVPNGANYMVFNISAYPNTITLSDVSNVQVEEGSTATDYAPYQNLDGMENYSNVETLIGTFLGKPLYRKVIEFTVNDTSQIVIHHNISNLSWVTKCDTSIYNQYGYYMASSKDIIDVNFDSNYIYFTSGWPTGNAKLIMEYTKN